MTGTTGTTRTTQWTISDRGVLSDFRTSERHTVLKDMRRGFSHPERTTESEHSQQSYRPLPVFALHVQEHDFFRTSERHTVLKDIRRGVSHPERTTESERWYQSYRPLLVKCANGERPITPVPSLRFGCTLWVGESPSHVLQNGVPFGSSKIRKS